MSAYCATCHSRRAAPAAIHVCHGERTGRRQSHDCWVYQQWSRQLTDTILHCAGAAGVEEAGLAGVAEAVEEGLAAEEDLAAEEGLATEEGLSAEEGLIGPEEALEG